MQITQVKEIIHRTYSQGVFCSSTSKNDRGDSIFELSAVSPLEIYDNQNTIHFKFIKVHNIGKVIMDSKGKLKHHTEKSQLKERLVAALTDINARTEKNGKHNDTEDSE